MADMKNCRLLESSELKNYFAEQYPYNEWVKNIIHLKDLPNADIQSKSQDTNKLCKAFGYTLEDIHEILRPRAMNGKEPVASMGADEPLAVLSKAHPPLYAYFKQRFAQVTNPPIDALREACKTDCSIYVGDDGVNILILSDLGINKGHLAIPLLLAVLTLEQHLIHIKKRTAVSVILESGEPRDTHQLAMLIAFGIRAVNLYLAHNCIKSMFPDTAEKAIKNYDDALTAGVLKIDSKMGVSTLQAY